MKRFVSVILLMDSRSFWHPPGKLPFIVGLIGMLLLPDAARLYAHTSIRVALDSNILVAGGRVIFAQGTGSLTVLDLATGDVCLRKKPALAFSYSGKLQNSAHGVLMLSYDRIALLDANTFDPIWQAAQCYRAATDGEHVVSHNEDHTVSCRKVRSGEVCWTVDMEGGWHLLVENGKVIVATPDYCQRQSALIVLDLESGRTLLRQEAPPGIHWFQVHFDGQRIYVVESLERDRSNPKPRNLTTLNLQGEVVAKVDCSSREVVLSATRGWDWNGCVWGDKYLSHDGDVQPINAHERKALVESWKQANHESLRMDFSRQSDCLPRLLPSGVFSGLPCQDAVGEMGQVLQMRMSNGFWKAYAPHLGQNGVVSQVSEAQGRLLVGTSEGHVECLDIETGRSHWLYMFPTIRQTMTYSVPHGMPPYLTKQADAYWEGVGKMKEIGGSITLAQEFDPALAKWSELRNSAKNTGRIVFDPSPDDPFPDLGGILLCWLFVPCFRSLVHLFY